jgi:hypothetical protein
MSRKTIRKTVKAEEGKLSADLGGRRTFNSGAGDEKGDGRVLRSFTRESDGVLSETQGYRIESKITKKTSRRLSIQTWLKIEEAAKKAGEVPIFSTTFILEGSAPFRLGVVDRRFGNAYLGALELSFAVQKRRARTFTLDYQMTAIGGRLEFLLCGTTGVYRHLQVVSWPHLVHELERLT